MQSTAQRTAPAVQTLSEPARIVYWLATALFCLEMGFTACYLLFVQPEGAQTIARLGFPSYFRVELAVAKFMGVAILLAPVPMRIKEWAYAGFAFNLVSAIFAHLAMHDGPPALAPSIITSVLWAISYFLWRRKQRA